MKCVAWSLQGLDHFISLPLGFLIFNLGFCILGALMGSTSFVESFVVEALHEDLGTIYNLPMFTNPQEVFAMHCVTPNARATYFVQCSHFQVFYNIMLSSIVVP
jgi:hypothetical protein